MHALSHRIALVAGALIALVGCYNNNAGVIGLDDAGPGPIGPGPDGGTGGAGEGGGGGDGGATGGGGAGGSGSGGSGGDGATGGTGGNPLTGQWQPPEVIEQQPGTGLKPHVAIGDGGEAVAVWVQSNLGAYNVRTNRHTSDAGWEGDEWLGTTDGNTMDLTETSQPYVVVDRSGVATAAWGDFDDPILRGVVSRRYEPPTGWAGISPVYQGAATAGDPRLSVDDSGNVMAVLSTGTGAWANYFQPVGGWGVAEIIDNEPNQPRSVGVALSPNGEGWAAWSQAPAGIVWDVFGNRFIPGAGWGDADPVAGSSTSSSLEPELAAAPNGDAVFVWQQTAGLNYHVWSSRWDAAEGALTSAKRLDSAATATLAAVATDGQSGAMAAWIQQEQTSSTTLQVAAAQYRVGSGWGNPVVLAEGDITSEPRVAMDAFGNAIVVYAQQAEYEVQVDAWAVLYSGGEWEEAFRLGEDAPNGDAFQPSVAMDPNGKAVVVWREGANIWASVFE